MRKYIVLVLSLGILLVSCAGLYMAYAPRTGPLGNGPDHGWIWWNFTISFSIGLLGLLQAFFLFRRQMKE